MCNKNPSDRVNDQTSITEQKIKYIQHITIAINILMVIIVGIYTFLANGQLKATRASNELNAKATQKSLELTRESLKLSRDTFLANLEPYVDITILELKKDARIKLTISNNSEIDLRNVQVFERFYASPFSDLASQKVMEAQSVLPTVKIGLLKSPQDRKFETYNYFKPSLYLSELNKGDRGIFVEFQVSFQHGITGKHYLQIQKYLILPSNTGWKFNKIADEALWVLTHFKRTE